MSAPRSPHCDQGQPSRVLAVNLREAPWSCLQDPELAPRLPCLGRLRAEGARATLLAQPPLDAASALWATAVTGRSPGGHGLFADVRRARRGGEHLDAPPIWLRVEKQGLPVGTFQVPFAHAANGGLGFRVSYDQRSRVHSDLVHPPRLYRELTRRYGRWPTSAAVRNLDDWSRVPAEIEQRGRILADLLTTRPWMFALASFFEISRCQHRFWSVNRPILHSVYAAVDRTLARLLEAVGPDTRIVVFSECGAGPLRSAVAIERWLQQEGFFQPAARRTRTRTRWIHRSLRSLLPSGNRLRPLRFAVRARIVAARFDPERTRAISSGGSGVTLRVPEEERDALGAEIRRRLLAWRDPEGRRVVSEVLPRSAWSPPSPAAPDLLIVWEDDAYAPVESLDPSDPVFDAWQRPGGNGGLTGTHQREGMFLAHGPGLHAVDLGERSTLDLVPTWLEMLGLDVPAELEGRSLYRELTRSPGGASSG